MNKYKNSIWISTGIIAVTSTIRSFLEFFSNPEPLHLFSPWFVVLNYFLFFLLTIFGIGYIIAKIIKEPTAKWIFKTAQYSPIIFLAPTIDLIVSQGNGICMAHAGTGGVLILYDLFTFFGKITTCGISIGIRIEIAIILIALGRIIWKKTRSFVKVGLGVFLSYLFIFTTLSLPGILAVLFGNFDYNTGAWIVQELSNSLIGTAHGYIATADAYYLPHAITILLTRIELILLLIIGVIISIENNRSHVIAWIKNSRWERILYYIFLAVAGSLTAYHYHAITYNWIDITGIICGIIAVASSFWSAVVWNDVNDVSIDAISNPDRPLLAKTIDRDSYVNQGIFFFILSLISALLVNYPFFFCIVLLQITYGIYSYKHTLWKKHFISSGLVIGFIGTTIFIGGYIFSQVTQSIDQLPLGIVLAIFGTITIVSHAKDFKDVAGDSANNIKTLPVLFGKRRASFILSIALIIWILILGIYHNSWFIAIQAIPWVILDLILRIKIPEYSRFLIFITQIILITLFFIYVYP